MLVYTHTLSGGGRFTAPASVTHRFAKHVNGFGHRPVESWRVGEFSVCILADRLAKRSLCIVKMYEKGSEMFMYAQPDTEDYAAFKKGRLEMLRQIEFLLPRHPFEDDVCDAIFLEREHYDANE